MSYYSSKDLKKRRDELDDRISRSTATITEGSVVDPTWTVLGNQITIMETLKFLMNLFPEPFDPGPNG